MVALPSDARRLQLTPGVMRTSQFLMWAGFALVACLAVASGYVVFKLVYGIPLQVDVHSGTIWVDAQLWGEYCSSLSRIRVTDPETDRTVWEARSNEPEGRTSVWTFELVPGENRLPDRISDGFQTVVPSAGSPFVLEPGRRYRIDVWGVSTLHHNARTFVTPQPASKSATHNYCVQLTAGAHLLGRQTSANARRS